MAELDLIVPGPLPDVTAHCLATLGPDSEPVEGMGSLGGPCGETEGEGNGSVEQGSSGSEGEEEILCDFCLGDSKVRAVKSCLTCMLNYCEEHLRPHQENSKLQNHQLTEPVKDQDLRTCPVHHSPLVAFCCVDLQCICQDCGQGDHKDHTLVSLDVARKDKEASTGVSLGEERGESMYLG